VDRCPGLVTGRHQGAEQQFLATLVQWIQDCGAPGRLDVFCPRTGWPGCPAASSMRGRPSSRTRTVTAGAAQPAVAVAGCPCGVKTPSITLTVTIGIVILPSIGTVA
jgi:hypothetical protein